MKISDKSFVEFEIKEDWFVLVEVEKADDGDLDYWLSHKDYGIMEHVIGMNKQDIFNNLKEDQLFANDLEELDLIFKDDESIVKFSCKFLKYQINEYIVDYIDRFFDEDDIESSTGYLEED